MVGLMVSLIECLLLGVQPWIQALVRAGNTYLPSFLRMRSSTLGNNHLIWAVISWVMTLSEDIKQI